MTSRNVGSRLSRGLPSLLACSLVLGAVSGCAGVRPISRYGHDLLQNDGYSAVARVPAGIGAMLGYIVAFPFGVILLPSYACDCAVVWNADGYSVKPQNVKPQDVEAQDVEAQDVEAQDVEAQDVQPQAAKDSAPAAAKPLLPAAGGAEGAPSTEAPPRDGDFYLPLAGAPFEYASGMGAAFVGAPFEYFMRLFEEPPTPPAGTVKETPELPPGEPDADLQFDVKVE